MKSFAQIKKPLLIASGVVATTVFFSSIGLAVFASTYQDRIAPNVFIGPIAVGGMSFSEAQNLLYIHTDALLAKGIPLSFEKEKKMITLVSIGTDNADIAADPIFFDIEQTLIEARTNDRHQNLLRDGISLLNAFFFPEQFPAIVHLDKPRLTELVKNAFSQKEEPAQNAQFDFSSMEHSGQIKIIPSQEGTKLDMESLFFDLQIQLEQLSLEPLTLQLIKEYPELTQNDLEPLLEKIISLLAKAPYVLTYHPDRFTQKEWPLTSDLIQKSLVPQKGYKGVNVSLQGETIDLFLESIANEIQKKPQDARFTIKEGRVTQFEPSEQGITLSKEKTLEAILNLWETAESGNEITVVTEKTDPQITTSAVNDFGIVELLGVGTSNFAGSPNNRIKNIENGVRLLQGKLIEPDQEFSLLEALGPFTAENGYLTELVIRGDQIIPEYGGGLCQIGSTTFRAAMNSGMKITQRQNHSLVVSYYNDSSNGNPGTDATIYDPAPDFRFINDTEQTILFQTEMDVSTGDLRFSFWGTSDGRKGSYSAPVVERWIPVGETRYIPTANIEPGKEKCQSSHIGADASFTYSVERPDGSIEETIFTSHYRPLPRICLVGIQEEKVEETTENKNTEITDSHQQTEEKKEETEEEKMDEVSTPAQQP